MIVAIHQPNLFPWLGYFHKINQADKFVFLDHVSVNTKTPSWFKRVFIEVNGSKFPLTLSLKKPPGSFCVIKDIQVHDDPRIIQKAHRTLEQNYRQSKYFREVFPLIESLMSSEAKYADRNIEFISKVCEKLGIGTKLYRSSELPVEGTSNELLISIVKELDGDIYLAGGGSAGYQNDDIFEQNSIQVRYQEFVHPKYVQQKVENFIEGLSILDALMNIGFEETSKLIKNGS